MSKILLIAFSALIMVACLGGESDTPTALVADTHKATDTVPAVKLITPGAYVGDYAWIDSNKAELESEFILDANGTFRLFWIQYNEALYDQRGQWHQKDSAFYFKNATEAWGSGSFFDGFTPVQDDTNAIAGVTDSSFQRREWTPLRQRPYWITYKRRSYPTLREGDYVLKQTSGSDSDSVSIKYSISLNNKEFSYSYAENSVELFQASAKYYQIGSFLATDENKNRELDSTQTFPDWSPFTGTILRRVQTVSDTAFSMWSPPQSFLDSGSWASYSKSVKN